MNTIYALIVYVCLVDERCEPVSPEVYTDLTTCVIEAAHQRAQGFDSYCEEMQEETIAQH